MVKKKFCEGSDNSQNGLKSRLRALVSELRAFYVLQKFNSQTQGNNDEKSEFSCLLLVVMVDLFC